MPSDFTLTPMYGMPPLDPETAADSVDEYGSATYYDCSDSDRFTHHEEWEALEEYIDSHRDSDECDTEAVIREMGDIEVTAYKRNTISDAWIATTARSCAEHIAERFDEEPEYGNPEDGTERKTIVRIAVDILPAVKEAIAKHLKPWHCNKCGSRTYSADELIAIARENCPEWFEETGNAE